MNTHKEFIESLQEFAKKMKPFLSGGVHYCRSNKNMYKILETVERRCMLVNPLSYDIGEGYNNTITYGILVADKINQ